jgi:hypothetical protein
LHSEVVQHAINSPTLNSEPNQTQNNPLHKRNILPLHAPHIPRNNAEADMPSGADIAVRDRDRGDDEFSDDEGDDGLPDGDAGGYEGAAELPVGEGDLVYGPEGYEAVLSGQSVGLIDGLY